MRFPANRIYSFLLFAFALFALLPVAAPAQSAEALPAIVGIVSDGEIPLGGAIVTEKNTPNSVQTNDNGEFVITPQKKYPATFVVKFIGYETREVLVSRDAAADSVHVVLQSIDYTMKDVVVIAYGQSSREKLTGAVSKIKEAAIEAATDNSPLTAVQGTVAGVYLEQTSGEPGDAVNLVVRGKTTFNSSTPLYVVDGVPFVSPIDNPLALINPRDIKSIEILKDADATAIYGNRGSNGVVLITTKRGTAGKLKVGLKLSGTSEWIAPRLDYLNTEDYLKMRHEAAAADVERGEMLDEEYTAINYPDFFKWSSTDYTDWQKVLLSHKSFATDAQLSLSGGGETTTFITNLGYYNTGSCSMGDNDYTRFTGKTGINYTSPNRRFKFEANMLFTRLVNNTHNDATPLYYVCTPPNMPMYDDNGHPYYSTGKNFERAPMATLEVQNESKTTSMNFAFVTSYKIWKELTAKVNIGYSHSSNNYESIYGTYHESPYVGGSSEAKYTNSHSESFLAEPQLTYRTPLFGGTLNALLGASYQFNSTKKTYMLGKKYPDDHLLYSASASGSIAEHYTAKYPTKAVSVFARLNYDYKDRYIGNLVVRRDGSSKFAPHHRYGTFWSLGAAWLFANENFVKNWAGSWLSHGKLRFSVGHTGGDGIGNYLYLNNYKTFKKNYKGFVSIYPANAANPDLTWEKTDKKDIGLELGFLDDRILFSTTFYHTKSYDMLTLMKFSAQTGFTDVTANLDAEVFNYGFEFELNTVNIRTKNFQWNTTFTLTLPTNKLHSFPGIEQSAYSKTYAIGRSLNCVYGYNFLGIDPQTGLGMLEDVNGDGHIDPEDYVFIGNTDPKFYGGLTNTLRYKDFSLDLTFYFRRKPFAPSFLQTNPYATGTVNTTREIYNNSWRRPGDVAKYIGFTSSAGTSVADNYGDLLQSQYGYCNASYLRLQNVRLAYHLPEPLLKQLRFTSAEIYLQGRNLFTITPFDGYDPETTKKGALPIPSSISIGVDLKF